jgi:drug/metabolite transporter (DMT)-like permease
MKIGLDNRLTAYQVASIRIVAAGIVLLPVAIRKVWHLPAKTLLLIFISGAVGSLIPAYLFCIAEEKIDSSLAGTLNCLTPIFVIITGLLFFSIVPPKGKLLGIFLALSGSSLLLFARGELQDSYQLGYVSLVVFATFLYGFNINMVSRHLTDISSFQIAAIALVLNAIPALFVLMVTGFFSLPLLQPDLLLATGAASLLGVVGTAIATVIFYMLVKGAGGIFASMVTYGIPFVAIGWGILYGERFTLPEIICLFIILSGVYLANRRKVAQVKA